MARIPVTDEIRAELKAEKERTQMGGTALLRGAKDKPEGLTGRSIDQWPELKTVDKNFLRYVLSRYKRQPSFADTHVAFTDDIFEELLAERERTGIGPKILLRRMEEVPGGLSEPTLSVLFIKTNKREFIRKDWLECIRKTYTEIPDGAGARAGKRYLLELTEDILDTIQKELDRTACPVFQIKEKAPTLSAWLAGKQKRAQRKQVTDVLKFLESLPDAPPIADISDIKSKAPQFRQRKERGPPIPVPAEFLDELERTGVKVQALWRLMSPYCRPKTYDPLYRWGKTTTLVRSDWLEEAMRVLKGLADFSEQPQKTARVPTLTQKEERVYITKDFIEFLKHHRERTGLTHDKLVGIERPEGLNGYMFGSWITGGTKTANPDHVEYIKDRLPSLPDKNI